MSQQQQMAMGGMAGGPVGGGGSIAQQQQMMNAGTPSSGDGGGINAIKRLNTAIYDYLLRNSMYDVARSFLKQVDIETDMKKSPNQRGQANGIGDDGMDIDIPEIKNRPDDLPAPLQLGEGPFLQDWWCQFWEIFQGYRGKGGKAQLLNYIGSQRQAQKARTSMVTAGGGMDAAGMQQMRFNNGMMMPGMNNGAMGMNNEVRRAAMQNRQNMNPQQLQQMQKMQGGNGMERQGSQMDMSGPRSGSPTSGDAPSPKRQRVEGNMQQLNQGRPGPPGHMPSNQVGLPPSTPNPNMSALDPALYAQTEQLLRQKGVDPTQIPPAQLHFLAMQPANYQAKSVETYSASLTQSMKAAMNKQNPQMPPNAAAAMAAGQGSPIPAGLDPNSDFYASAAANGGRPGQGVPQQMTMQNQSNNAGSGQAGSNNNGNHALQDYQMQLMLLEQQNKKRLLMARQEQDSMANPGMPGGGPGGQYPGGPPQSMSPGSQMRAGDPSPSAGDMRGTPKMNKGMSPNGDMAGRGSPQPGMMGGPGMIPEQLRQQMMANGQMMRPPSTSHPNPMAHGAPLSNEQMAMMRAQNAQINGAWPPGQPPPNMMQPGQGPPNPNMTPRQQPMGPPPAPQSGTGPSSPAQPPAPPTPSQTTKAKPGGKKEGGKKGGNKKGAQANAIPVPEAEAPPTPTPATPNTPYAQNSFNHASNKNLPNGQQAPQPQPPPQQQNHIPQPPPPQQNVPQPPPSQDMQPFGSLDPDGFGTLNLDFGPLEGADVLDNFDFDSFLNTGDGDPSGLAFDANFAFGDGALEADLTGGN